MTFKNVHRHHMRLSKQEQGILHFQRTCVLICCVLFQPPVLAVIKRAGVRNVKLSDTNDEAACLISGRCIPDPVIIILTLKVLVATIDAQWDGMGDVGSTR